jgi:hypothetical protein
VAIARLHRASRALWTVAAATALAAAAPAQETPQRPSAPAAQGGHATFARSSGGDQTDEARRLQQFSRFLLKQSRNVATVEIEGAEVMVHVGKLAIDGEDYRALEALTPGAVLALPNAAACKLRAEAELRFGETVVPTGNASPGYASLYSVWLRAPSGELSDWHLVFNDEADVWGTQRDPARDRVEVALAHELAADEAKELTVAIATRDGDNGGVLELRWGPHRWRAPFAVEARSDTAAR